MIRALRQFTLLVVLGGTSPLPAETTANASDTREGDLVQLSPFTVSATASSAGRYTSLEAISAGRVRMDIMDLSQSVSVITSEMLADVAGGRVVDTTRYVAGVSDSTLPTSWERTNMRGFQAEGRTVDGITYGAYPSGGVQNIDPAMIERIEIVKGPNSILAPQPTSPGGTINLATKKPQFRDFDVVGVQWGQFDANSGIIDVNHRANSRLAFRFVGSGRYGDHWWENAYVHSTTLMPEFTYRISAKTQATFQYTYTDWNAQNYLGLPIDPTSSTTTAAHLLAGVPRDLNPYSGDVSRATRQHELKVIATTALCPGVQMRFVAAYNIASEHLVQINTGASTGGPGGSTDPLTGIWNYGVRYASTPPFAPSPLTTLPTRVYTRSGIELIADPRQFNLQNDYAYIFENRALESTTLAGFASSEIRNDNAKAYNLTVAVPTFDIDRVTPTPWARASFNYSNHTVNWFTQFYASENLALFQNRLFLNVAESWQHYDSHVDDLLTQRSATVTTNTALPSYGVVIKPCRDAFSFYYSRTEQSSSNGASTTASVPPLSTSQQNEFGARFMPWGNRCYFTVAHYSIVQDNFATPNPANLTTPPPNPLLPALFSDRKARGWEYELRANPTRNLSLIASYTHFRNRDPNGIEFRGVAEHAGGLLASYAFGQDDVPALAGFRIAVGIDYLGNRPGDTPLNSITVASTPTQVIPTLPSFYLGARTLVNLTLTYESNRHWSVQVNVDNLLDHAYLLASNSRFAVFPGTPRNIRVAFRYGF